MTRPAAPPEPAQSFAAAPFAPRLGALVRDDGVMFRAWAPAQQELWLVLEGRDDLPMVAEGDGCFVAHVDDARAGHRYWFRLHQGLRPDPASRFQPDGPLGVSEVVDPRTFRWTDSAWPGAGPVHRHVIYEMHLGTFTPEGTWAAAEARLPALADLGMTLLEVMPVAEFAGRFGWGYDCVDLFAPSRLYGTPDDGRHFVDTAHRLGLAVILDVVYNHFGPVGNYLRDFSPTVFGRPGEWGDSINYDGPGAAAVRAFMVENAAYWIHDFHFDGLRFDATQGIHDSSPEHILAEMSRAARAAAGSRSIFLVGESEPQDARLLRRGGLYSDGLDALWNEDWHHAAHVALTGRRDAYFTDYLGTASEFASMARHGFLYQGQWYSWQSNPRGHHALGLPSCSFVSFLENHDQVANTGLGVRLIEGVDRGRWRAFTSLLLLGPGLPMLFQGQEYASTQPFTYFADHEGDLGEAVRRGRFESLAQFPGLSAEAMRARLRNPNDEAAFRRCALQPDERDPNGWAMRLHRDLIALRRHDPVLSRLGTPEVTIESSAPHATVVLLRYLSRMGHRLIVVNIGDDHLSPMNDPLLAPPGGPWTLRWASDDPDYGGPGTAPFVEAGRWLMRARSAALLEAESGVRTSSSATR